MEEEDTGSWLRTEGVMKIEVVGRPRRYRVAVEQAYGEDWKTWERLTLDEVRGDIKLHDGTVELPMELQQGG